MLGEAIDSMAANCAVIPTGSLYHTGYVVRDIVTSVRRWVELAGVGPFVLFEDFEFVNPRYRGSPGGPKVTLAFGYGGNTCIELIQPNDSSASIYSELSGGLHHIGIGVPDLEAAARRYRAAGVESAFEAAFPFGGGCAYMDTIGTLGVFTELVELGPIVTGLLEQIRAAHQNWNRIDHTFLLT